MDQAALETALQVTNFMPVISCHGESCADMGDCKWCRLQDFIVNLAGMEFGAGGHPGLQV